jgi:hypothetical protein
VALLGHPVVQSNTLEGVLHAEFHDSVSNVVRSGTKRACLGTSDATARCGAGRAGDDLSPVIEQEAKVIVAGSERQQPNVHEVEGGDAELHVLALLDFEVLHHCQVAVPIFWSAHVGHGSVPKLAGRLRPKAARIDELVRSPLSSRRIAQESREYSDIRRSQKVDVVLIRSPLGKIEIAGLARAAIQKLLATLNLCDTGDLPAIRCPPQEGIAALQVGKA